MADQDKGLREIAPRFSLFIVAGTNDRSPSVCCQFAHDPGWTAVDLQRSFASVDSNAGPCPQPTFEADGSVEPVGQYLDQEAADERHRSVIRFVTSGAVGPVIVPFENHALTVEGDEPAVGNSDPMRVARQIGEHRVGSADWRLGIDHPFDLAQWGEVGHCPTPASTTPSIGSMPSSTMIGKPTLTLAEAENACQCRCRIGRGARA